MAASHAGHPLLCAQSPHSASRPSGLGSAFQRVAAGICPSSSPPSQGRRWEQIAGPSLLLMHHHANPTTPLAERASRSLRGLPRDREPRQRSGTVTWPVCSTGDGPSLAFASCWKIAWNAKGEFIWAGVSSTLSLLANRLIPFDPSPSVDWPFQTDL
jgi:hypothetical protein